MVKKFVVFALFCASFLAGEEYPSIPDLSNLEGESLLPEMERSQYLYLAGGLNPFPTVSLGYRKLYCSMGSDISLCGSAFPMPGCGKMGAVVVPGAVYKQLFFSAKDWQKLEAGKTAFYWGAQTGVYYLGDMAVSLGGLAGWQFSRKKGSDFFELGISPLIYIDKRVVPAPLFGLNYAIMF